MDELAGLQAAHLGYHEREQGVGRNIEGDAQEDVRAALVQLAGQFAVGYIELEQAVAGREGHLVHFGRVPGAHEHAAGVRIALDGVNHLGKLVDGAAVRGGPAAPLVAIDRPQVSVFVGPLIPDGDAVVLEILHVGIAGDEPQEFVDDGFQVDFLGGEEGEALGQVETHLIAENTLGAGAGAVLFHGPVGADVPKQV